MARTRSAEAHRKVVRAAIELIAARGIDATSMDAIALASGVSKATIYKHWLDKDSLVLEAMAELHGLHVRPAFNSGHTQKDMVAVLSYRPEENARLREKMLPHFMVYSAQNAAFGAAWRRMVMEPPRKELKNLIELGWRRHELSPEIDLEVALALLLGPMIYSHVFLQRSGTSAHRLAERVVDSFWRAWRLP